MATIVYQCPATRSLRLSGSIFIRVRPSEYFAINSTDSATIADLAAQGFDVADQPLVPSADKKFSLPDQLHPHNAFGLSDPVNEINTITADATPATAGTFTLTVSGQTTAGIAYNATAAAIETALEALSNVVPGDVTAIATTGANLGAASAVVTLTWGGAFAGTNVTITADMAGLTGNPHVFATPTQGG